MSDPRTQPKDGATVVKTLPQLAEEIGVHRSTLVRLEQRGIISPAPVVGKPIQGRVYDAKLEATVKKEVAEYFRQRDIAANMKRPEAPSNLIVK